MAVALEVPKPNSIRVRPHRRKRMVRDAHGSAPTPQEVDARAFLRDIERMSVAERIYASRWSWTLRQRNLWAAHFPGEQPLLDGELEWIAATLE